MCGGTAGGATGALQRQGLSPRVRGNLRKAIRQANFHRSIPACAGEPRAWASPAHPDSGLSPRVRGNRGQGIAGTSGIGSIPACAGEPSITNRARQLPKVYPRVCGGTTPRRKPPRAMPGLSPRVRGNPAPPELCPRRRRSIPACAGEPGTAHAAAGTAQVYPRVCGGTSSGGQKAAWAEGLSPRVRGNPAAVPDAPIAPRSIPACAGEPVIDLVKGKRGGVYPRVCGGTCWRESWTARGEGLSPRVRGNLLAGELDGAGGGSIPACAGEPGRQRAYGKSRKVYPRVCGGTVGGRRNTRGAGGLSPRVRGNPTARESPAPGAGSIPACAGEPRRHRRRPRRRRVYPRVCGGTSVDQPAICGVNGLSPRVRGNPLGC